MSEQYLSEIVMRANSPASLFIGGILLVCLLVGLFGNNQGGKK